jgi:hypothetical protein
MEIALLRGAWEVTHCNEIGEAIVKGWSIAAGAVLLSAFGMFAGSTAASANVVLTFEGIGDQAAIGGFYNGGPGGNLGIQFGTDSLAIIEDSAGGSGNFSNPPSGTTVAFFLAGAGDIMNIPAGFDTGFSFFYADQVGFTGSVQVYSGIDGTGTLLASLSLPATPNPYTVFVPIGVAFAGVAESVVFGGAANFIAFDDITLGSVTAGDTGIPEPVSLSLLAVSVGGLITIRRRRRA